MVNPLDCAPLPDQIRPGNKVVLSAAGGWAAPTTGQQHIARMILTMPSPLPWPSRAFLQHPRLHQLRKPSSDAKHSR